MEENLKKSQYVSILSKYLEELTVGYNAQPSRQLDYEAIIDVERGHFQLLKLGWYNRQYIYSVLVHFDVKEEGKVWIQLNDTEMLVADEIVQRGIAKEDIVLGYKPDYLRPYTGFAAA
jgi:hypothetical protein